MLSVLLYCIAVLSMLMLHSFYKPHDKAEMDNKLQKKNKERLKSITSKIHQKTEAVNMARRKSSLPSFTKK
ncbi:unnamed protein product [Brachionus calyciflorus]|uniref:Uncharacterized protein n=1 Tax=Brachionus calyciflorus TaxID=104777 RepID=A0A813TBB5_9BILA|nr:unnamed protein product [Brachionus calyciflorus]